MSDREQGQKAGRDSQQIQVGGDMVFVQGVTESRAAEIAEAKAREVAESLTAEAVPVARARINSFNAKLIEALASSGLLETDELRRVLGVLENRAQIGSLDNTCVQALGTELNRRPTLARVRQWWDELPTAFEITGVGRSIAVANAWRLDSEGLLPSNVLT